MLVISLLFFRYTIREEIQADGVLSTISIKRTERGDSALFTCVATNAFGKSMWVDAQPLDAAAATLVSR